MTIFEPEIAGLCGALDSAAVVNGGAFSSHLLRPLVRTANRMIAKENQMFSLFWQLPTSTAGAGYVAAASTIWTRILPIIDAPKKPGLRSATITLYGNVTTVDDVVDFSIGTLARPFNPARVPDISATGIGAPFSEDFEIPVTPGDQERIEIWARGRPVYTLGDTGTYGSPNTGAFSGTLGPDFLYDPAATWNQSDGGTTASWDTGGHVIRFEDSMGNPVSPPLSIYHVHVTSPGTTLNFTPSLSPQQIRAANIASYYSIYRMPTFEIYNFSGYANAREA